MSRKLLQTRYAAMVLCWAGLFFAAQGQASCTVFDEPVSQATLSPYRLIETVTDEVLAKIDRHRAEIGSVVEESVKQQKTRCFFGEVDNILGQVVDFEWISLKVMGTYSKVASTEQKELFAEAFRSGLVETYGRGLLSYSSQKIVFLSDDVDVGDKRKVSVRQEIQGVDTRYPLDYTMGLRDGQWKVLNVVINGINLGKTFRGQFVQSAEQFEGDLDKVIASWDSGINNG